MVCRREVSRLEGDKRYFLAANAPDANEVKVEVRICNWRSGAVLRNSADDAQLFCGGRVHSALLGSSSVPTTCFHFRSLFCSFWLLCKLYHCKELDSYTAHGFPFRKKNPEE